jgi:hypothetical protein
MWTTASCWVWTLRLPRKLHRLNLDAITSAQQRRLWRHHGNAMDVIAAQNLLSMFALIMTTRTFGLWMRYQVMRCRTTVSLTVIPAKAGIQRSLTVLPWRNSLQTWIPAFAGMTVGV